MGDFCHRIIENLLLLSKEVSCLANCKDAENVQGVEYNFIECIRPYECVFDRIVKIKYVNFTLYMCFIIYLFVSSRENIAESLFCIL